MGVMAWSSWRRMTHVELYRKKNKPMAQGLPICGLRPNHVCE
jgi:hypothetical protein